MVTVNRYAENPIITPKDIKPSFPDWEVLCAFNAGACIYQDETILLLRVAERPIPDDFGVIKVPVFDSSIPKPGIKILKFTANDAGIDLSDSRIIKFPGKLYLTSISHLRVARSKDGRNFNIDETPSLFPENEYEAFGIEDPRITKLGDTYYIVYKGVAPECITQCLASTKDFVNYERYGIIFPPENMDAMIFPQKIRGKYAALHRPQPKMMGSPNMWIAYSEDLINWGEHKLLLTADQCNATGGRVGGGCVPILTDQGWLTIYHAGTPDDYYYLGALLLDKDYPEKLIARSTTPILEPQEEYETKGFKDNVVFTCGAIDNGDKLTIYYGAADEVMAAADLSIKEILDSLVRV